MQHCDQLPQHNTWWLIISFTTNQLDVSSPRVNLFNFCDSSGVCNSRDVEKHLNRNRILVGGCCAAEHVSISTDMTKYLVCFYTSHLKQLICIFSGSKVIQFLHWLCSFWMFSTMGLSTRSAGNVNRKRRHCQCPALTVHKTEMYGCA
jgi:hypothetical protein